MSRRPASLVTSLPTDSSRPSATAWVTEVRPSSRLRQPPAALRIPKIAATSTRPASDRARQPMARRAGSGELSVPPAAAAREPCQQLLQRLAELGGFAVGRRQALLVDIDSQRVTDLGGAPQAEPFPEGLVLRRAAGGEHAPETETDVVHCALDVFDPVRRE